MIDSIKTRIEQRFLVAKYIPDIRRMEPRNIGIILWCAGDVATRFLEPSDAKFVRDQATYQRWMSYWTQQVGKDELTLPRRPAIQKDSPEYLDELITTQKGNYLLVDGGEVLDHVNDVVDAVDFLFSEIVVAAGKTKLEAPLFSTDVSMSLCREVFKDLDLWKRPDFWKSSRGHDIPCMVHNVWKVLNFDYGLGTGKPQSAFLRVRIDRDTSWQSAAFRFNWIQQSKVLSRERCGAIVNVPEAALSEQGIKDNLQVMKNICPVANLSQYDEARHIIHQVALG